MLLVRPKPGKKMPRPGKKMPRSGKKVPHPGKKMPPILAAAPSAVTVTDLPAPVLFCP